MKNIRKRLRQHRKRYGLTICGQAKALGLRHANTLYNIENEIVTSPYKADELHLRLDRHVAENPK